MHNLFIRNLINTYSDISQNTCRSINNLLYTLQYKLTKWITPNSQLWRYRYHS